MHETFYLSNDMANIKSDIATLFFFLDCNIGKSGFEVVKNVLLILAGFIILFGKPALGNTLRTFCESGEPEVINETEIGKGEIQFDSISLTRSWLVHVNKEDNSGIDINFQSFLLEDYFLVIQDGTDNGSNYSMVQLISGRSDKPLLFRIPFCPSFYMEFCPENGPLSKFSSFNMSFSRIVFEDSLPEEKPNIQIEKESYEVQLKGHAPEKYTESGFLLELKEVIKSMSQVYCRDSNITFDVEKTVNEMVTIFAVRHCPAEWYDSHICASIKHSVYVTPEHKGPTAVWNYELRKNHLQEMWGRANDSDLEKLKLSIYKFPKKDEMLGWWSLLIVLPPVILTVVTISVMKIYGYLKGDKQLKRSAGTESMTTSSRRRSKLKPNKHQYIPPFVKNQSKKSYLHKSRGLYGVDGQNIQERSYIGALLFSKLPRGYSSYKNDT